MLQVPSPGPFRSCSIARHPSPDSLSLTHCKLQPTGPLFLNELTLPPFRTHDRLVIPRPTGSATPDGPVPSMMNSWFNGSNWPVPEESEYSHPSMQACGLLTPNLHFGSDVKSLHAWQNVKRKRPMVLEQPLRLLRSQWLLHSLWLRPLNRTMHACAHEMCWLEPMPGSLQQYFKLRQYCAHVSSSKVNRGGVSFLRKHFSDKEDLPHSVRKFLSLEP
mmetsp:Transcript_131907/g.367750  ORF Transcript_131907/g.367750 Transcript_131907/m.367750 type:complete len:218 (+) Transcript_131907:330-983(+)